MYAVQPTVFFWSSSLSTFLRVIIKYLTYFLLLSIKTVYTVNY